MKLLAFAASSSKTSINKQLVIYASTLLDGAQVEILDLNDYELPLYSVNKEKELGHPELSLGRIAAQQLQVVAHAGGEYPEGVPPLSH